MSRPVSSKLTKIVLTGNKGGTGKTTITALLAEYLTHQKKKVQLIDTDPNQALKFWIDNIRTRKPSRLLCRSISERKTVGNLKLLVQINLLFRRKISK